MNEEQVVSLITSVGFPITACCALFYLYDKTMNNVILTLKEVTEVLRGIKNDLERKEGSEDVRG